MINRWSVGAAAWGLLISLSAQGAQEPSLAQLKQELQQLKQTYGSRIQMLEQRIAAMEQAPPPQPAPAPTQQRANAFNPGISLILNGTAARMSRDPEAYAIPGFPLDGEAGPGEEGLSIAESELVVSANVDDKFYGRVTAAISPEDELELEEAYLQTLALPEGLTLKAGRFFSDIGYLNSKHPHSWDFVDAPLAYRALLGNTFGDDGVQLRWLAPTDQYVELGAEVFRGDAFPTAGAAKGGAGTRSLFVHTGGDVGMSTSWRAGLSWLTGEAVNREVPSGYVFNGSTDLAIADFVWKWAPNGNPYRRNLVLQAEYLHRAEDGSYVIGPATNPYDVQQSGWYAQAVYQFMPRWRAGIRFDRLHADDPGSAFRNTLLDPAGHTPRRTSLMLDFSNSEYSRIRLQYNRDESGSELDHQWYLQYIMSLGAHGAHRY